MGRGGAGGGGWFGTEVEWCWRLERRRRLLGPPAAAAAGWGRGVRPARLWLRGGGGGEQEECRLGVGGARWRPGGAVRRDGRYRAGDGSDAHDAALDRRAGADQAQAPGAAIAARGLRLHDAARRHAAGGDGGAEGARAAFAAAGGGHPVHRVGAWVPAARAGRHQPVEAPSAGPRRALLDAAARGTHQPAAA